MQFRERGSTVSMIRTVYSKEKQRGISTTVCKFKSYNPKLTESDKEILTEKEIEEFEQWVDERDKKNAEYHRSSSVMSIESMIADSARALEFDDAKELLDKERAKRIYASIDALTKQMKKAGFSRASLKKGEKKGENIGE